MRAVIQRVKKAAVVIDGETTGEIARGLLIFLGIEADDQQEDIDWLCRKILKMRIFPDEQKPMNISMETIHAEALIVSQFTLHASTKKGNRPSFIKAAKPKISKPLYEEFVYRFNALSGKAAATGKFGADMQVSLVNDGPVTIVIDSKQRE